MSDDCQCEAPPECDIECEKGQKKDLWACECLDKPMCDLCEAGQKQHPWTCECKDYWSHDIKCRWGGDLDSDACMCSATRGEETREFEPKCKRGYELNDACDSCDIKEGWMNKPIKCANGQGWNAEENRCDFWVCPEAEECEEGFFWHKMKCECQEKKDRKAEGAMHKGDKRGSGDNGNESLKKGKGQKGQKGQKEQGKEEGQGNRQRSRNSQSSRSGRGN